MRRPLRPGPLLLGARSLATLSPATRQAVPIALAAIRLPGRIQLLPHRRDRLPRAARHHRRGPAPGPSQGPGPLGQQQLAGRQRAVRLAVHRPHRPAGQVDLLQGPLVRPEQPLGVPATMPPLSHLVSALHAGLRDRLKGRWASEMVSPRGRQLRRVRLVGPGPAIAAEPA
jgi:hypothetical protein